MLCVNVLIRSGLVLVIAVLAACSSQPDGVPTVAAPTPVQVEPSTPKPQVRPTPTSEPNSAVLAAPGKTTRSRELIDAPDRDLFRLTRELVPGSGAIPRTVIKDGGEYLAGRSDTFWLVDLTDTVAYQSTFELVLVTPHAHWYVEEGLSVSQSGIERSAERFEEHTYPAITGVFGNEWNPGVDNDPRMTILNARLNGVAGYFSSTDEYPKGVRPRSNEREMIYINALGVPPGAGNYDEVLAHELQHAIHWNADASEDTWVNEGLAELSTSIAFGSPFSVQRFLRGAPTSLVNWPTLPVGSITNYGASSLFMHFLTEHYGGRDDLRPLLAQQEDSIAGIDSYLTYLGEKSRFEDVFREWAAANILDGDGILGYADLEVRASISGTIKGFDDQSSEIPQYAVEYTELRSISEPFTLTFHGSTTTQLLPIDVGSAGCWWSNTGDSIDATLSHRVVLPAGSTAALDYEVWFEIEEDWDYVYVEASVDGGKTWRIIETPLTSPENPIGNGFGSGYTGESGGWVRESVDLSPFAGEDLWVRIQYVTDDAVNGSGACFRDLSVKAAGITPEDEGWEARGFVFTDNLVPQAFQVQLITLGDDSRVRQVTLDDGNSGKLASLPPGEGERLIVAVGSLAKKTRQPASYTLSVGPGE